MTPFQRINLALGMVVLAVLAAAAARRQHLSPDLAATAGMAELEQEVEIPDIRRPAALQTVRPHACHTLIQPLTTTISLCMDNYNGSDISKS